MSCELIALSKNIVIELCRHEWGRRWATRLGRSGRHMLHVTAVDRVCRLQQLISSPPWISINLTTQLPHDIQQVIWSRAFVLFFDYSVLRRFNAKLPGWMRPISAGNKMYAQIQKYCKNLQTTTQSAKGILPKITFIHAADKCKINGYHLQELCAHVLKNLLIANSWWVLYLY